MGNPKMELAHNFLAKNVRYALKFVKEQCVQKKNFAVTFAAHLTQPQPKALPLCI